MVSRYLFCATFIPVVQRLGIDVIHYATVVVAATGVGLFLPPIGVGFFINSNPAVSNRQETTMYHFTMMGRYLFPYEIGFSANYRYQSGYPYARIVPDCGCLNISNYMADFFVEPLENNRSDNVGLLNFRLDKSFQISWAKVSAMLDIYNVTNADPVTNFNLTSGSSYKRVIATLDPRVFQMGFRLEF